MSESTELREAIERLEVTQVKAVSLSWSFYRGVFYGAGFFIGGTVLVALVVYLLTLFDTAPLVGDYVSKVLEIINTPK